MISLLPREPIAGTCGATGSATIKYRAPSHFYAAAVMVLKVDGGTPNWILAAAAGGAPLALGAGRNVIIGPVFFDPGEQVVLAVNGADPNAKVLGQVIGFQSDTPEELVARVGQLPTPFNSRAIVDFNPVVRISAASAVGQAVVSVADVTPFHVDQVADVSQNGKTSTTAVVLSVNANDPTGADPSGTLTLNANLRDSYTTAGWVMVLGVTGAFGGPSFVAIASGSPGILALVKKPSAGRVTINNLSTTTFIAGQAGQIIYLFWALVYFDAAGSIDVWLVDSAVPATPIFRIDNRLIDPPPIVGQGAPITAAGNGLGLNNQSGAAITATMSTVYGQA